MVKLIRLKKQVKTSEVKPEELKSPEPDTFFEEPLSKDETIIKNAIENIGKSLKVEQIICNSENCEEIDCNHFKLHDKIKTCGEVCGIHSETKCI